MKRFSVCAGALLFSVAWTQSGPHQAVYAGGSAGPLDLSQWLPTPSSSLDARPNSTGKLGYHITRTVQYCPGMPADQTCNWFAPNAVFAHLNMDNLGGNGRIGKPANINLECDHFRTDNGVTAVQSGVAAYFTQPSVPWATITAGSIAGILSPDTPTNWYADRHSLGFAHVQGAYLLGYLNTSYAILGGEARDNLWQRPTAGGLIADVRGTLINFKYNGSRFEFMGYSQGHVTCLTGVTSPAGPGRSSWGYNQVFFNS